MTAPAAPISHAEPAVATPGSTVIGAGGFDSASTPLFPGMLGPATLSPSEPGPLPVGGPGSDIVGGGPAGEACEDPLELKTVLAVRVATAAIANTVLPTSPRASRLAMKGINMIA
ncbi:MAG TPA: hypothetical protein VG122_14375, partial [Gemmata sp.]|nr:hypothetical protein [Gemmata sp.]